MKKVLLVLAVLGSLVSSAQTYSITKRMEQSTAKMGLLSSGFSYQKCDGAITITDSSVTIKNKHEDLNLTITSKSITTLSPSMTVGIVNAVDGKNNNYSFTLSNHMINVVGNIWNEEKGVLDAVTLIYYVK